MVATSFVKKRRSRHHLQMRQGRDISYKGSKVATSVNGRDIICKERRSRRHSVVTTSFVKKRKSRHHSVVATSAASKEGRDISYKELRSRRHSAVATSDPRDAKGKLRPNKSFCDVAVTTEVATKNRGRDINNQMGQLT